MELQPDGQGSNLIIKCAAIRGVCRERRARQGRVPNCLSAQPGFRGFPRLAARQHRGKRGANATPRPRLIRSFRDNWGRGARGCPHPGAPGVRGRPRNGIAEESCLEPEVSSKDRYEFRDDWLETRDPGVARIAPTCLTKHVPVHSQPRPPLPAHRDADTPAPPHPGAPGEEGGRNRVLRALPFRPAARTCGSH